jgi:hypothetical protein
MADAVTAPRTCEHRHPNEDPCAAPAAFRVSPGRNHDAQDSCRRHLALTVDAVCGEDRDTVTVEQITEAGHARSRAV